MKKNTTERTSNNTLNEREQPSAVALNLMKQVWVESGNTKMLAIRGGEYGVMVANMLSIPSSGSRRKTNTSNGRG